jgi:cytoskeletal protein RodZ
MRPRRRLHLLRAGTLVFLVAAGLAAAASIGSARTSVADTTTSTATTTTTASPPANTGLPTISGTARDGSLLTASTGSWTGSPSSYAYRWLRCDAQGGGCGPIAGADSRQYTVTSTDVGHTLRVQVTAANAAGNGSATSSPTAVVQASGSAPASTHPPSLAGTARQGSTLTAGTGSWSGSAPMTFDYTWQRCDAHGGSCSTFIAHAGTTSYTLTGADVGHTLRVEVTARNAYGSGDAYSPVSGSVAPAVTTGGSEAIAVASVSLPDRLVIDRVRFSPDPIRSRRTAIVARFHVADLHGRSVQGALVFVLGLPYGWSFNAPEQATDADGWATLVIRPTPRMPLRRGDLVLFVRARKPGDSLLAGVSTRRLVQERIG